MSRGLSSAITDELAKGQYQMAHLVKLELNTTYKYTNASTNIVDGSDTYIPNGFLMGLDGVQENSNINIGSMNIGISAVDQTVIADVLNNGYLNRKVTIKRAFLDSNSTLISGAIFSIYSGRIEGMGISDSSNSSVMNLAVANQWTDFNRTAGRRTNNASQQHFFAGDKSMEFAPQTGKKLIWGAYGARNLGSESTDFDDPSNMNAGLFGYTEDSYYDQFGGSGYDSDDQEQSAPIAPPPGYNVEYGYR